jgi:hypothetical protein
MPFGWAMNVVYDLFFAAELLCNVRTFCNTDILRIQCLVTDVHYNFFTLMKPVNLDVA